MCRSRNDVFFRRREEKNARTKSMSNIGEDRILANAVAIQALKTFVGPESLATSATTVVDGVNEVRQDALGASAATVLNSKAISDETARAVKKEGELSAAVGEETTRASFKGSVVGNFREPTPGECYVAK